MKKHMLQEECDYPENNALYLMLLSGDLVTYGDEGRTKQRHIATHQIYKGVLDHSGDNEEEWYVYDISGLLREYAKEYAISEVAEKVKSLMESTGFSLEQSLNALKIQGEERKLIIEKLQQ